MIKVILIEDDDEIRSSMELFLAKSIDIEVIGSFDRAESFISVFGLLPTDPDVVLMDITLPGINGIECVSRLKPLRPGIQYLMCTVHEDPGRTYESLQAGATGYILKSIPPKKLIEAIQDIYRGGSPMSASIARFVVNSFQDRKTNQELLKSLNAREQEILVALSKGFQYKEIADQMFISIETVRTYIRKIYEKLHVHSKVDAINKVFNRA